MSFIFPLKYLHTISRRKRQISSASIEDSCFDVGFELQLSITSLLDVSFFATYIIPNILGVFISELMQGVCIQIAHLNCILFCSTGLAYTVCSSYIRKVYWSYMKTWLHKFATCVDRYIELFEHYPYRRSDEAMSMFV